MSMQQLTDLSGQRFIAGISGWSKYPYGVKLPEDPGKMFRTLLEQETFAVDGEIVDENTKQSIKEWYITLREKDNEIQMEGKKEGDDSPVLQFEGESQSKIYESPNYTDTRVGGNDAINPYWQFNRDDDIVPKLLMVSGVDHPGEDYGMGRVYSERYDSTQQILWLCMGVAEFTDLISFYMDSGDAMAAKTMNRGSIFGLGAKILKIAIKGTIWAFSFPIVAPFWLFRWISRADANRVTRYYWFVPTMTLYYEFINTMLSYLAVGMGIYPLFMTKRFDATKVLTEGEGYKEYSAGFNGWGKELGNTKYNASETGIPELLKDGPDIFVIMNRRAKLFNNNRVTATTRDLLEATATEEKAKQLFGSYSENYNLTTEEGSSGKKSIWKRATERTKNIFSNIKGTMFGAGDFIGFRVERSSNASESVSNETGPTAIAQKLNSIAQQAKDEYESSLGGNFFMRLANKMADGGNVADSFMDVARGATVRGLTNMASAVGVGDIASILTNGNGFLDIPDVWKGSSFNKSYSFNVDLYSRYGDPVSIYQAIYIPMILLLGASLPRSIGTSMYTSPFLIKAFCRGQFAIACGVVTSIDITRGKEEHGWNVNMLPTQVSISLSIKDMTPTMFMGMQDIGLFDTMSRNEPLHEYLDTLSALGISERLFVLPKALRKASAALLIKRNTIFSSTYWSGRLGRTPVARALAYMAPFGNFEKTDMNRNAAVLKGL